MNALGCVLALLCAVCTLNDVTISPLCPASAQPVNNLMIVWQYVNYTNYLGTVASGQCCDNSSLSAPNCPPNQCDTSFAHCATTTQIQSDCNVQNFERTATTFDNNAIQFGGWIGDTTSQGCQGCITNRVRSLFIRKVPFTLKHFKFEINAFEVNANLTQWDPISTWNFTIDWYDTAFSAHPNWHHMILKDNHAELGIQVASQCAKYYFGTGCSIYCRDTNTATYTCNATTGDRICNSGWYGSDCNINTDKCMGNLCHAGSTCVTVLNNYTCLCPPQYTGPSTPKPTACDTRPCLNSGTCIPLQGGAFECTCSSFFGGSLCEKAHAAFTADSPTVGFSGATGRLESGVMIFLHAKTGSSYYNTSDGSFKAPRSGTYQLSLTLALHDDGHLTKAYIRVNEDTVGQTSASGGTDGSVSAVYHMDMGDVAWVKVIQIQHGSITNSSVLAGQLDPTGCVFTGMLIK